MKIRERLSPQVLIVDDETGFCEILRIYLKDAGYHSITANSIDEAKEILSNNSVQCIILDLYIVHGSYVPDGLEILDYLKSRVNIIPTIIITQKSNDQNLSIVYNDYRNYVIGFISKNLYGFKEDTVKYIREAFYSPSGINWELEFEFHDGLSLDVMTALIKDLMVDEIEMIELIGRAFPKSPKVDIFPMKPGFSGAGVVRVIPHYLTTNDQIIMGETCVLKYGNQIKISTEARNYKTFVEQLSKNLRRTSLINEPVYTRQLGALVYAFIGADSQNIISFSEFYKNTNDIDSIEDILENLFNDTCSIWYSEKKRDFINFSEKHKTDKIEVDEWASHNEPDLLTNRFIKFEEIDLDLPNPLLLMSKFGNKTYQIYKSITHGDLHGNNIYVDQSKKETWLIDFYKTAYDHIFVDFTKLETVIKFELLENRNLGILLKVEKSILLPDKLTAEINLPKGEFPIEIIKMINTINLIRNYAAQYTRPMLKDIKPYNLSLFYTTAKALTFETKDIDKKRHILLSLCLLGEKLTATI